MRFEEFWSRTEAEERREELEAEGYEVDMERVSSAENPDLFFILIINMP